MTLAPTTTVPTFSDSCLQSSMANEPKYDGMHSRSRLLRNLLVFQVKLWAEGLKDVALVPLSLTAAVIDLVFLGIFRRSALYAVMELGTRFEAWVNLYGAIENVPRRADQASRVGLSNQKGGETKQEVDRGLSTLHRRRSGPDDDAR